MDEWRVDLAVAGSQKGLMLPAGLGFVCASPRALSAYKSAQLKRVYFDFGDMIKANATGYFPYTPALPCCMACVSPSRFCSRKKLEHVFERHNVLASGVRAAVKAWACIPAPRTEMVFGHGNRDRRPAGFNGADVIDAAFRRYDLSLGAGLSQVAGKVFRIGHLGDLNDLMVLGAIAGAEMAMRDVGIDIKLGSALPPPRSISVRPSWRRKRSRRIRSISPSCTRKASSTTEALHRILRSRPSTHQSGRRRGCP